MVMMEQAFWLILFLAVVGIAALIAAAMMWQKESIQQSGTPTGQRSYQEEYSAPDFTESAGFAVTMYPSTDILIPGRFWLINRKTAEIEYNVIPAGGRSAAGCSNRAAGCAGYLSGLSIRKRGHCAD